MDYDEYILVYAPLVGFILVNKRTMEETTISEAEALKYAYEMLDLYA